MTTAQPGQEQRMELKPCPIDSGKAEWREIPIRGTGSSGMEAPDLSIRCTVCGLETTRESTERWEKGRGTYSIRDEAEKKLLARWNTRPTADLGEDGEQSTAEEDAEWLRRVARGQNAMVRYTHMHPKALSNIDRIADRLILYREALEAAAENFERLQVPHIVGHDVHNFAFQAAKQARALLSRSGDD